MDKEVKKQFNEFVTKVVDLHGNTPLDTSVIIRVFRFVPEAGPVFIQGMDGENLVQEKKSRVYNIARVLEAGAKSSYKKDDLCCLPDYYFQSVVNPDYLYVKEMLKERPAPEITEFPPKHVMRLSTELEKYMIILDKFAEELSMEDKLTFCIPDALIRNKYEYTDKH
jgi:hypothetical protein